METQGTDTVELEIQVTLRDIFRFNAWHRYRRWYAVLAYGVFLALALFLTVGVVFAGSSIAREQLFPIMIFLWVFLVLTQLFTRWRIARSFRSNAALQTPVRYAVSTNGVSLDASWGSARQAWSVYRRAGESRSAFYLYMSHMQAQILPKRCFTSPEQMDRFRQLVRAGNGARRRSSDGNRCTLPRRPLRSLRNPHRQFHPLLSRPVPPRHGRRRRARRRRGLRRDGPIPMTPATVAASTPPRPTSSPSATNSA